MNESVIKAATKDKNFSLQAGPFLHITPVSNHTVWDYWIKSAREKQHPCDWHAILMKVLTSHLIFLTD